MRVSARATAAVVCLTVLLAGCTDGRGGSGTADDPASAPVAPATTVPDAAVTVLPDADPVAAAVSASRALFESSGLVVLSASDDLPALALAASTAVALGVPLLLTPSGTSAAPPSGAEDPVSGELARLGAIRVVALGAAAAEVALPDAVVQVDAPGLDPAAVSDLIGIDLLVGEPTTAEALPGAIATLDSAAPAALSIPPADGTPPAPSSAPPEQDAPTFPDVTRPRAPAGTFALATSAPESSAGIATARAAGVGVVVVPADRADPRASAEAVTALSEAKPDNVLAIGAGFAAQDGLDWKLATAATGTQLPGGGQLLFPEHFFVALYGFTEGPALGVLGEQDADASVVRAQQSAAQYADLVPRTVVPMFEIIATVASSEAGDDGDYSAEASIEQLQPWVDAAGAAGVYVVLDLQPGRTDFLTQAMRYEPLLRLPYVGLALDPEWRLLPDQVHLQQIGSVSIEEVNAVVSWLADLTRDNSLPQKMLVLHQFRLDMIRNRELLDTTREELAVLIHVDGQGSQAAKQDTWATLHQNAPANVYWGWKNFLDEDTPVLTPQQTIEQALPTPELVTYQ